MTNTTKGVVALLISSLGFALMSFLIKYSGDLPTVQKTFFRNFISMMISLALVVYYKEKLFGRRENQTLLLLRSTFGLMGVLINFYVIDRLVLSDAEILNKLSPFFTIILCAIFLKEHIKKFQFISIMIAFIGAVFIIKPSASSDALFALVGVLGALCAASAYTILRVLGDREKFFTVVFYFSTFSTIALLPFFIYQYEAMSTKQIFTLILAGICASLGQFGITIAYSFAPAREISIFIYSSILFTALLSIFIFEEIPDPLSIMGYFIIFSASYYMFMKNRKPKLNI